MNTRCLARCFLFSFDDVCVSCQQQDAGDFDPFTSGNDGGASDFVMTGDTEQPTNIPGLDDLDVSIPRLLYQVLTYRECSVL